jgi:hypothetical protein
MANEAEFVNVSEKSGSAVPDSQVAVASTDNLEGYFPNSPFELDVVPHTGRAVSC